MNSRTMLNLTITLLVFFTLCIFAVSVVLHAKHPCTDERTITEVVVGLGGPAQRPLTYCAERR